VNDGAAAQDCQRVFRVGARARRVRQLRLRGLELRLGLGHDACADEARPELDREEPDLLLVGGHGVLQDLDLGVQRANRVVVLRHVGLDGEPHDPDVVGGGLRRGTGRLQ